MQVFKFGGASVKDAEAVKNVAEILKKYAVKETIVVVSAMGKTTNGLEELVNSFFYHFKAFLILLLVIFSIELIIKHKYCI